MGPWDRPNSRTITRPATRATVATHSIAASAPFKNDSKATRLPAIASYSMLIFLFALILENDTKPIFSLKTLIFPARGRLNHFWMVRMGGAGDDGGTVGGTGSGTFPRSHHLSLNSFFFLQALLKL